MKAVASICIFFLAASFAATAQTAKTDTAFISASINFARDLYATQLKGESPLHNGTEYSEYISLQEEHPYFLGDDWLTGSIVYQNDLYENVPLQFDISSDKVIAEHATSARKIQLITEKIKEFTIDGHRFIKLEKKASNNFSLTPGFYELITEGSGVTLLARRVKTLQRKISAEKPTAEFEEITRYYYLKDGNYYPVKGKKSVLQVLGDKKSLLKQQMKKNKVRFGSTREQALKETAKLYNTLNQQP